MIRFENVTFEYPDTGKPVLKNFTQNFEPGSIVAVTGPNGCGKTTATKLAAGILKPQQGRITIDGMDIADMNLCETGQLIGYVYQDPTRQLFCETVYEEIAFALRNLNLEEEEISKRTEYYMKFFRLEKHRKSYPGTMSQGEKQRVMLACIMAIGTRYIILDEPTSGLDMQGREALGSLLEQMRNQNRGVIIVSHERSFIERYADLEIRMTAVSTADAGESDNQADMNKCNISENATSKSWCIFSLDKTDPRMKLLIMAVISTVSVLSRNVFELFVLLMFLLIFLVAGGVSIGKAVKKAGTVLKLIASLFVIQCLFARDGRALLSIYGVTVITSGGLEMALIVCIRLLILTCSALLLLTGKSRDYLLGLTQMHVPYEIAFMVMIALKFLPVLRDEARDVMTAVQLRGTMIEDAGMAAKLRVYTKIMIPVVAGALRRAEQMNIAMQARAFRLYPQRSSMRHISLRISDVVMAVITIAIVAMIKLVTVMYM